MARSSKLAAGALWILLAGGTITLGAAGAVAWDRSSLASEPALACNATLAPAALPKGQVVRRALREDPLQEYFVYVPSTGGVGAPLFVTVHGISRNAEEHAKLFSKFAESYGVVLVAPYFTSSHHDDYQRLGRDGRRRADQTLDAIVTEVASSTGAAADKIRLFGFSGGAQFAHRYAMAHPERVAAAVIGAAGWYTFPDASIPYPYGIGPSSELPDVQFDLEAALRVPITVLVGEADLGSENLRHNDAVDRQQGLTRVERARNWVAAMQRAAAERGLASHVRCESVPGIQHSFSQFMHEGELGERVFGALFDAHAGGEP